MALFTDWKYVIRNKKMVKKYEKRKIIRSYQDLLVYQRLYKAMILVLTKVIPFLPNEEKFDLVSQMRRCCKAGPALLAEGFAKRYQKRSWRKYLDDTIGECNEMIHHLSVCIDVYGRFVDVNLCNRLVDLYNVTNKQIYKLKLTWKDFHHQD